MMSNQSATWTRVGDRDSITPGEASVLAVDPPVAVWSVDGEIYATDDTCTHEMFSLAEGYLDGCEVECALHWAKFDVRTGAPVGLPAYPRLRSYPVQVTDGVIFVDLSSRASS
jgi:3-phenylpropionate/trans-cinnamate dioxygenase ferredoxin subunit